MESPSVARLEGSDKDRRPRVLVRAPVASARAPDGGYHRRVRTLLATVALLLVACDPVQVGGPQPSPRSTPEEPAAVPDPGDAPCETLTRAECMRSLVCTLDAPEGARSDRYRCRSARGNCEMGLTQTGPNARDRCEDRTGCAWTGGGCYCHCRGYGRTAVPDGDEAEDCDCECSGGPPPRCGPR